jgi:nucleotide-binding universal stress UspA family protein
MRSVKAWALFMSLFLGVVALLYPRSSLAGGAVVPADLQAELLSKLVGYDRNFAKRAGSTATVLLVTDPSNPRSRMSAAVMKSELAKLDRLGGLPHREVLVTFETAAALVSHCRTERAALVYLTAGLDSDVPAIQAALAGVDVLSVSATPEDVPQGIVLGFELISGKPKILLNLAQAKRQNVDFKSDVLKLMRVYR